VGGRRRDAAFWIGDDLVKTAARTRRGEVRNNRALHALLPWPVRGRTASSTSLAVAAGRGVSTETTREFFCP
jgi:hypothetical protein